MAKFWLYFKRVVLVWGFIWLAIVIFIALTFALQNMGKPTEAVQQVQPDEGFKKSVGGIDINVTKIENDLERLLVSVRRNGNEPVTNFELPVQEFELGWIDVNDAHLFPLGEKGFRIVLFTTNQESDHEVLRSYIWLLKLDEEISFEKMIEISGFSRIPGDESRVYGNRVVHLPSFDEEVYREIDVPVEIQVGKTLRVRPMLTRQSLELLRQHYSKTIQDRIELLSKKKDEALLAKYMAAARELDDCLVENIIPAK